MKLTIEQWKVVLKAPAYYAKHGATRGEIETVYRTQHDIAENVNLPIN